jgi:uncharacterized membrane protein YgdD (TMEM256/DUF423 family)
MDRGFLLAGTVFGLLGVALGAFGAHALRAKVSPERLITFETGVRYMLYHAFALFAVVAVRTWGPDSTASALAGTAFVVGVLLFSGSLFLLVLADMPRWGAVTPLGGVILLVGWAALAYAVLVTSFVFDAVR